MEFIWLSCLLKAFYQMTQFGYHKGRSTVTHPFWLHITGISHCRVRLLMCVFNLLILFMLGLAQQTLVCKCLLL